MEESKTVVVTCESMQGICKYNDYGICKLKSIILECGECASFKEEDE